MILYLEAMALASRDFATEEMDLPPHPIPTIYYMTPDHPNCVVDISSVWELKEQAMNKLKMQMTFTASVLKKRFSEETLKTVVPDISSFTSDLEIGKALHRQMDKAFHLYHGLLGHGSKYTLAEPYRREGCFNLDQLIL